MDGLVTRGPRMAEIANTNVAKGRMPRANPTHKGSCMKLNKSFPIYFIYFSQNTMAVAQIAFIKTC